MNKYTYNQGFAALAIVMLIGMLAVFFILNTTVRGWSQEKNVSESQTAAQARLNAISCINLARLRLATNGAAGQGTSSDANTIGSYFVKNGYCEIESVSRSGAYFYVHTSAGLQYAKIELEAEIDAADLKIASIQEL